MKIHIRDLVSGISKPTPLTLVHERETALRKKIGYESAVGILFALVR
ncbi:hypothetical protein BCU13_005190 [Vibrio lentus]|nr:hypothetical protein [Vibrio lentus]